MRDFKYGQVWKISILKYCLFLFSFPISFIKAELYIQNPDITAKEILLNSLKFDGGIERLQSIKTIEGVSRLTLLDSTTISIVFKREQSKGYLASTLAEGYDNPTTIFNSRSLAILKDGAIEYVSEKNKLDELELQTYILPEFGYFKLGYKLEKFPDQKFQHFDCFVISATSKNGYYTLNYFDKSNFRLIMVVYPSTRKTVFTDFKFIEGVLVHTEVMQVDEQNKVIASNLEKINFNKEINSLWFDIPTSTTRTLPDSIKTGTFLPLHDPNVQLVRTTDTQIESKGNLKIYNTISWTKEFEYKLTFTKSENAPGILEIGDSILVKIISFKDNIYLSHYYSKHGSGANTYKKINSTR